MPFRFRTTENRDGASREAEGQLDPAVVVVEDDGAYGVG